MLQYISKKSNKYNAEQQAQMVVEGGCRWIEIDLPDSDDNEVRNAAKDMIDLCREHDAFLIIRDHIDVVDELKVSGIRVSDPKVAGEVRERLGANAIVGVTVTNVEEVLSLKGKDVDYVVVMDLDPSQTRAFVQAVRDGGMTDMPVVIEEGVTIENLDEYLDAGVSGIAMSRAILGAPDPMLYTSKVMEHLLDIKPQK